MNRSGVKKSFIGAVGNLTRRTIVYSGLRFSKIVPSGDLQAIGGFAVVVGVCGGIIGCLWSSREWSEAEGVCNKSYKFKAKMRLFLSFF